MHNWFAIHLGDALLAGPDFDDLQLELTEIYEQAGKPADMAAFYRHETSASLFCSVSVYLSPAFSAHAEALYATPCPKPESFGLTFFAGSTDLEIN